MIGTGSASSINGFGNPFGGNENYLTIFEGTLVIPTGEAGTYNFAVDGDDAVEVIIDGTVIAGWYDGHGKCDCQSNNGTVTLLAGDHTIKFRHEELGGGDSYFLYWEKSRPASVITDYVVRTQVCVASVLEANCQVYPDGNYKPVGLLQNYGENDSMYFGLLTGSYEKNTSGGVLRKNIGSITDEINANDGTYTATIGIIGSMDRLKTVGFGGSYSYTDNCGWITSRAINEGECRMWGNPVAEMMYEGMRYFSGKATPTSAYNIASSGNDDTTLGRHLPG